jgi:hypothetical protein
LGLGVGWDVAVAKGSGIVGIWVGRRDAHGLERF